jgi:hypothetical protein
MIKATEKNFVVISERLTQEFFFGGFNKFSLGQRAERTAFISILKRRETSLSHFDVCHTTSQAVMKSVHACIGSGGGHMEHVL